MSAMTRRDARGRGAAGRRLAATSAWAQQPQTARVRGTIEKVDGNDPDGEGA